MNNTLCLLIKGYMYDSKMMYIFPKHINKILYNIYSNVYIYMSVHFECVYIYVCMYIHVYIYTHIHKMYVHTLTIYIYIHS